MDRNELRFRILFEYYEDFHASDDRDLDAKIGAMDVDENEKRAAMVWLIDSGHVVGSTIGGLGTRQVTPLITRINDHGINFVESIMDSTVAGTESGDKEIDPLSKTDKIKRFAAECLGNPTTGSMCRAAFDAIMSYMSTMPQ